MQRAVGVWLACGLIGAVLAGCANGDAVYRYGVVSHRWPTVTTVDAKERVILSSPVQTRTTYAGTGTSEAGKRGKGGITVNATGDRTIAASYVRFCAEPSPDVFSVLATSLSGTGTFSKSADPKALDAALSAAFASSEQGSTISRTQTISMLREVMYRTCERYINGAISDLEMPAQMARDQRAMVAILAIDQLTDKTPPSPTVISASSTAALAASSEAAVRLDDAFKASQAADAALAKARGELAGMKTKCDALQARVDKGEVLKDVAADPATNTAKVDDATQKKACDDKKAEVDKDDKAAKPLAAHYAALNEAIAKSGMSATATVGTPTTGGAGAGGGKADQVALVVQHIVDKTFDQDEVMMLCLKVLDPGVGAEQVEEVRKTCIEYVKANVNAETAQKKAEAAQFNLDFAQTTKALTERAMPLFEAFWKKVAAGDASTSEVADPNALKSTINGYRGPGRNRGKDAVLARMLTLTGKAEIKDIFNSLPSYDQDGLSTWSAP